MGKLQKSLTILGLSAGALITTHVINSVIFSTSVSLHVTDTEDRLTFHWRLGDISYTKQGQGSPLLLVHDTTTYSSTYEWSNVIESLSANHTVYAIDLLGCGYSDKPEITYTTYLYVQLLTDFITKIIGKRTDVIVTGASSPSVLMACYNNNTLFNKIILVNPIGVSEAEKTSSIKEKHLRVLLNLPVIGSTIYNMFSSKEAIKDFCKSKLFYNENIPNGIINAYHELSHMGGFNAKFLFTSLICKYFSVSLKKALLSIDNSITIISGENAINAAKIADEYVSINAAIETATIPRAKHLPQLERATRFVNKVKIYI